MPAKKNRQSVASNDRRNDTGLIAPGKKVVRQRSNPSLNGHVKGVPLQPNAHWPTHDDLKNRPTSSQDCSHNHESPSTTDEPCRFHIPDLSSESTLISEMQNGTMDDRHASPQDITVHSTQPPSPHSVNGHVGRDDDSRNTSLIDGATTIIGPHTRFDMFAILLILLQLPWQLQAFVHFVFAYMTFGNTSLSWFPLTIQFPTDWFKSHGGNPSAIVSIVADIVVFGLWVGLPGRNFILDLAPAVVAISLGGGTATRESWKHAGFCTAVVFIRNLFRDQRHRQHFLNAIWTCMSKLSGSPMAISSAIPIFPFYTQAVRHWARTALELHIVTHGGVRIIRRYLDGSAERSHHRSTAQFDNEVAVMLNGTPPAAPIDNPADGHRNASTDGRPPGQPPTTREKSVSSGKKRKNQGKLVRSQQPFWAAFANARINVSREVELSQGERDSYEAEARDTGRLGDASVHCHDDRVWITKIDDTEVWFHALILSLGSDSSETEAPLDARCGGSAESKFVDVCVNGAFWTSIDCVEWTDDGPHSKRRVAGKITGLMPMTSYSIQIRRSSDQDILYATILTTRPVTDLDQAVEISSQTQDSLRPSSPATTLKKSIAAVESKFQDCKARQGKTRRVHQSATKGLKAEVADLKRNLVPSDQEQRQKNRKLQVQKTIEQAEESYNDISMKLANLGDIPKADHDDFDASQERHDAAIKRIIQLKRAVEAGKREALKEIQQAQAENTRLRAKREKAENRLAMLNDKRKTTSDDNETRRLAKVHNQSIHAYNVARQQEQERILLQNLTNCKMERHELEAKIVEMQHQRQQIFLDSTYVQPYNGHPHTPESSFVNVAQSARVPPGAIFQPPFRQNSGRIGLRGRSSSMLSNVSGFTDRETPPQTFDDGHGPTRNGSGSGSSGVISPPHLSPIGAEMGRGSPRQSKR